MESKGKFYTFSTQDPSAPVRVSIHVLEDDVFLCEETLEFKGLKELGEWALKSQQGQVWHTPGHTPPCPACEEVSDE